MQIRLAHLLSGLDHGDVDSNESGAWRSSITGYTEWRSDCIPAITVGWDWEMYFVDGRIWLRRISAPRSNLIIQDPDCSDLPYKASIHAQEIFIDALAWQPIVQAHLNSRYR